MSIQHPAASLEQGSGESHYLSDRDEVWTLIYLSIRDSIGFWYKYY